MLMSKNVNNDVSKDSPISSLLQSATAFFYYKVRQLFHYKVRQVLLQRATGITKCDNFITKCDDYYKVMFFCLSDFF